MYKLKIYQDQSADNPRTSRDCLPPLYTNGGRGYGINEYGFDFMELVNKKLTNKNKYKVADAIDISKQEIKDEAKNYYYNDTYNVIQDKISELENIEDMETVLNVLGYKTHQRTSRGYSQGDCVDCLMVASDEYIIDTGLKKKDIDFTSEAELYDARAWGDTYGYRVYKIIPLYREDGTLSDETEEEEVNSCRGFYGDGGMEQIKSEIGKYVTDEEFDEARENIIF